MITRQQAIARLEDVGRQLASLKTALEEGWGDDAREGETQAFLDKCGGWEDPRSVDEIVAEVYEARTRTDRGAAIFGETGS